MADHSMTRRWCICSVAAAVSFTWAAEDMIFIPALTRMGASTSLSSWVFLSNAVLGICVSPGMGAWSDRLGRRRPFLVGGAVGAGLSMVALLLSGQLQSPELRIVLFFAFAGALEFCVDLLLLAGRSLACDHASGDDEIEATHAAYGLAINAGRFLSMVVGSAPLQAIWPFYDYEVCLFCLAAAFVLAASLLAVSVAPDVAKPAEVPASDAAGGQWQLMPQLPKGASKWLLLQCVAAWSAIVCQGMYFTSMAPTSNADALPVIHVQQAAMAAQSGVAIAASRLLPLLNSTFGIMPVNSSALLGFCFILSSLRFVQDSWYLILLLAMTGLTCAVIDCNPYVIAERLEASEANRAAVIALLDNTLNAAQVLCSICLGTLLDFLGGRHHDLFAVIGSVAGLCVVIVAVLLSRSDWSKHASPTANEKAD
eukprot:TRINITY_DN93025_c0_g1_i1.p1 TRINITY_DN93025_c0_g1~~TRINITY_DN93025_c0_g1_i1.p1  ORF type:complete len:425 (-),score=107.69 TRINITY_DN93025_c0_g1_i1:65-1339(-)